jgi:UDP-N-acetylglucosamine--N-acetylmuramyl-(pentapeptide) pyrophosphoryl-undecaprenol N-acetylglucosamine transferase
VFGVGGYVTGPVLLAAKLCGKPACIHEQNTVPGLANRMAARLVDKIFLSLPSSYPFPQQKVLYSGNPVRRAIVEAEAGEEEKGRPMQTLLVLGGSQGAHQINRMVVDAVRMMAEQGIQLEVIHQTGKNDLESVRQAYEQLTVPTKSKAFFNDMASLYCRADLVVSRAGATTLAELAVIGLPAILIPYPHAADDHQQSNALHYANGGGVEIVKENECNGQILAEKITTLLHKPHALHTMGRSMRSLARPDATERIVDTCLELIGRES